jgi:adenine phosphoribosyltransferase
MLQPHATTEGATAGLASRIREQVRDVADFPQPGILFKDITPVLADANLLADITRHFASQYRTAGVHVVAGIESRGFIFGAPLAVALGAGFIPIRKPGKLPAQTMRVDYALEYGTDALEAHTDAVRPGQRVLIVDDVLATGGTAAGAVELVQRLGGDIVGLAFLIELAFLNGRSRLGHVPASALVTY